MFKIQIRTTVLYGCFLLKFLFLCIRLDRVIAVVLFHFEEQLEVGDECRSELFQRNITGLVPLFDELLEVFVNDAVFPIAVQTFEFTDLRLVVHAQTYIGIANFLGGNIVVARFQLAFRWLRFGFDIAVRFSLNPLFTTFLLQSAPILEFSLYLCQKNKAVHETTQRT